MPRASKQPNPTANRVDRLAPEPVTTVPGQAYGAAAQQRAAQRAVPMAGGPTLPANQGPGGPASSPAPQGSPGPIDLMSAVQGFNGPGNQNFLRPTERPNEPVTAGLPTGPGPGPESLTGVGAAARDNAVQQGTLAHLLQNMAAQPQATAAIRDLAARALSGAQ